jgi:hypothetical protein
MFKVEFMGCVQMENVNNETEIIGQGNTKIKLLWI